MLRRPPRGPLAPSTHDVLREARLLRALDGTRRARAAGARGLRGRGGHRRAVLRHGARPRRGADERAAARARHAGERAALRRGARRRARRGPRRRLARLRPRGLLERPRRLPRAPAAALRRAVGAPPHARRARRRARSRAWLSRAPAGLGRRRRSSTATTGWATSCCRPRAPARLRAIFDWELATLGDPLADVGYLCALWSERDDPPLGAFELSRVTREPGFPTRDELVARYEAAQRPGDDRHPLVPHARAVEGDDLHGGQLPPRARGQRRTTPGCRASARASSRSPSARATTR